MCKRKSPSKKKGRKEARTAAIHRHRQTLPKKDVMRLCIVCPFFLHYVFCLRESLAAYCRARTRKDNGTLKGGDILCGLSRGVCDFVGDVARQSRVVLFQKLHLSVDFLWRGIAWSLSAPKGRLVRRAALWCCALAVENTARGLFSVLLRHVAQKYCLQSVVHSACASPFPPKVPRLFPLEMAPFERVVRGERRTRQ